MEKRNFNWTNDVIVILLELCKEFIEKNGRTQSFKWKDIQKDFIVRTNRKVSNYKILKNKYDTMKTDWRLWKCLKQSEIDLRWDPITRKLDCSNEWWETKIQEKPKVKKFRYKGVPHSIEELWDYLFGDVVPNGSECVASSMNPSTLVVHLESMVNGRAFQSLESDNSTNNDILKAQTQANSVNMAMNILNHVDGLVLGSDLWCYGAYLIESEVRRNIFLAMKDDASRLAWLKVMHDMKSNK